MFSTSKPIDPNEPYETIKVDNKTFYRYPITIRKRRYSDQFKRKNEYDTFRKLRIVLKHKDIDFRKKIDKWKTCIDECICVLKNEFMFPVDELFKIFELEKYGFKKDNY